MAKALIFICFCFIFQAQILLSAKTQTSSQLLAVNNFFRTEDGQRPLGSIYGGTFVTIIGQGFDKNNPGNNQVYFGAYPCTVKESTREQIICETSPPTNIYPDYPNFYQAHPIKVVVGSKQAFINIYYNFDYHSGITPSIRFIYPFTIIGETNIKIEGDHRINFLANEPNKVGQNFKVSIAKSPCQKRGYTEQYLSNSSYLGCRLNDDAEAGYYNISYWTYYGYPHRYDTMKIWNFERNFQYEAVVLPAITKVSPSSGTSQMIHIQGAGFKNDKENVKVNVGGRGCDIKIISTKSIECRINQTRDLNPKIPTNSTQTQKFGYISGSGWSYKRYGFLNLNSNISNIRNLSENSFGSPTISTVKAQLRGPTAVTSYFVDVYKGYFKPPASGQYIFKGLSHGKFALFISDCYGSAQIHQNKSALIYSNEPTGVISHPTFQKGKIISEVLNMQKDKYYYMQLYHISWDGFFEISVEMPNERPSQIPGQVYPVHRFSIKMETEPQIIQFVQEGARSGTIRLSLTRQNANFQVIYRTTYIINFNASIQQFLRAINSISGFHQYSQYITGQRHIFDENLVNITDYVNRTGNYSTAYRYVWKIYINYSRNLTFISQQLQVQYDVTGGQYFSQSTIQQFSPLVSGTFRIELNGRFLSFTNNYNQNVSQFSFQQSAQNIEKALKKVIGYEQISVKREKDPNYGASWTIFYSKVLFQPPYLRFDSSKLEGGKAGTSPRVQMITLQGYKNSLTQIVDHRFMFTASEEAAVKVEIDGLTSVCLSDCTYSYNQASPGVAITYNPGDLIVNLTINSSNIAIRSLEIRQKYSGSICTVMTNSVLPAFSCLLQENQDHTPKIQSGPVEFEVFYPEIGIIPHKTPTSFRYNIDITLLYPIQGSNSGGYNVTVQGRGLYLSNQSRRKVSITLCDQQAQIIENNHKKVVFLAPSCSSTGLKNISIKIGQQEVNKQFNYKSISPTQPYIRIDSINPNSINPALKRPLKIIGEGFGNNLNQLQITFYRSDGVKVYLLKPLKVNNTCLEVGFPGSIPGIYIMNVKKTLNGRHIMSRGQSANSTFVKVGVFIYSIYPQTGSPYGGTILKILGQNFSPEPLDNIINIGEKINNFCQIISVNQTEIHCLTPRASSSSPQKVYVNTKITQDSLCSNSTSLCLFRYNDLASYSGPIIYNSSIKEFNTTAQRAILRTNNNSGWEANYELVVKNIITKSSVAVSRPYRIINESSLEFSLPSIQSGYYELFVKSSTGQSPSIYFNMTMSLRDTPNSISQKGGFFIIKGMGLPSNPSSKLFQYKYENNNQNKNIKVQIIQSNPQSLKIFIKPNFQEQGQSGYFKIQGPINQVTFYMAFTIKNPLNWTLNQNQNSAGNISFSIGNSSMISYVRFYSKVNQDIYFDVDKLSVYNSTTNFTNFTRLLPPGAYEIWANLESPLEKGWYILSTQINITRGSLTLPLNKTMGVNGGLIKFANSAQILSNTTRIKVNGQYGNLFKIQQNHSYFYLPSKFGRTGNQQIEYSNRGKKMNMNLIDELRSRMIEHQFFSDMENVSSQISSYPFNQDRSTKYSSKNRSCYVGFNIADLSTMFKIKKLYLELGQNNLERFRNISIEVTKDGSEWENLLKLPKGAIKTKYTFNIQDIRSNQRSNQAYIGLRFSDQAGQSKCEIDLITVFGWLQPNPSQINQNKYYDMQITDGFTFQKRQRFICFSEAATPIVEQITPKTGDYSGGYNLTIKGQNLQGQAEVYIDSIPCPISFNNNTHITCLVQQRPEGIQIESFDVIVNGSFSNFKTEKFKYVLRWSDHRTWGLSFKPVDGDLIHIPKGQVLMVDQSTPKLAGIVVEGKVIFSDQSPMTITTDFILVKKGQLQAGTIQKPYNNTLVFKLTGNEKSKRQPIYGTKFIGCQSCRFSMHGKGLSNIRWANLNQTIQPNQTRALLSSSIVQNSQNSLVGSQVVVTSTSDSSAQAQFLKIAETDSDYIETYEPFRYRHISTVIQNRRVGAQIGFISSNILIQGIDNYQGQKFGAKLMFRGEQNVDRSQFKVSNIEITKCGQPSIYNQHCISVMGFGISTQSYIKKSSIHDTYSRGIHFTNKIIDFVVEENLIFNTQGHSIQIENPQSAILINNNLIINPLSTSRITLKDTTPAAIHFLGPMNTLQSNHFGGGSFYGLWFDLQNQNRYPCSWGYQYSNKSQSNYLHSFNDIAIYIDKISSQSAICGHSTNQQKYQTHIKSFIIFKSRVGLSVKQSNMITVSNCIFIENEIHFRLFDSMIYENSSKLVNSSFYGALDKQQNSSLNKAQTFIELPCSSIFKISDIKFVNLNNNRSRILKSCMPLYWYYRRTDELFIDRVVYNNVSLAKILQLVYAYYDRLLIVYDTDGSFSNIQYSQSNSTRRLYTQSINSKTIVSNFTYLSDPSCFNPNNNTSNLTWQHLFVCNSSVKIRKMRLKHNCHYIKISSIENFTTPNLNLRQTYFYYRYDTIELPLIMDKYYQFQTNGCQPRQMRAQMISIYRPGDGSAVLRYKYMESRQLFEVKLYVNDSSQQLSQPQTNLQIANPLDVSLCNNGDFYHQNSKRVFGFCMSQRNMTETQEVRITPIFCKYDCPAPDQVVQDMCNIVQQSNFRVWSNESMWPSQRLPVDGDNVTIEKEWKVILNINPPKMNTLIIKGTLIIPNELDQTVLQVNNMWIQGSLKAGNSSIPFGKNLTIKIGGNPYRTPLVVDSLENGTNMMVVTGLLSLYGDYPATVWTKLTQTIYPGATKMKVMRNYGWKIGDQIVIGPSFSDFFQTQYVKITEIVSNTISFYPAINFTHYGKSQPASIQGQDVDMRAAIGHLTRNIKIISGSQTRQGFRLLTYGYSQCNYPKFGILKMSGVQVVGGGQYPYQNIPRPAIHIKRLTNPTVKSSIQSCSIHHCRSSCIGLQSSSNIKINNNLIASAKSMHINVISKQAKSITITDNLMVDVKKSLFTNKVACFQWKQEVYRTQGNIVQNNLCQGSEGVGFSRNFDSCRYFNQSLYSKNTVGSSFIGFLLFGQSSCSSVSGLLAFGCSVGVLGNPRSNQINYKSIIVLDSKIGISLRSISKSANQSSFIMNSYISALERSDCTQCYGNQVNICNDIIGISMFVPTQENPWNLISNGYYILMEQLNRLTQSPFDAKAFIINSTFGNFRGNYSSSDCRNNFLLMPPHNSEQLIGSHHFYNTTCVNCDIESITNFTEPNKNLVGPKNSCGQFQCTGKLNYFVEDHTGHLFTSILNPGSVNQRLRGTLVPSQNSFIHYLGSGNKSHIPLRFNYTLINDQANDPNTSAKCYLINQRLAFYCMKYRFYILQFQGIGKDYDSRVTWPVTISNFNLSFWTQTYYNYNWNRSQINNNTSNSTGYSYQIPTPNPEWSSQINTFRQWNFNSLSGTSLTTRINRYNALLLANQTYNITFRSTPPKDMRLQLQNRIAFMEQQDVNFLILRVYYAYPNNIRVQVNNQIIEPITHIQNSLQDPLMSLIHICGAHKYQYKHRVLQLIINNKKLCQPRLTVTNSIQLTAKFSMNVDDFYNSDGRTHFIDRIVALLGIDDRSRLKVVGIYRGSTIIESFIEQKRNQIQENGTLTNQTDGTDDLNELYRKLDQLYSSGIIEESFKALGFGELILFSANLQISKEEQETPDINILDPKQKQKQDQIKAIANAIPMLAISIGSFVLILFIGLVCMIKKKLAKKIANSHLDKIAEQSEGKKLEVTEQQFVNAADGSIVNDSSVWDKTNEKENSLYFKNDSQFIERMGQRKQSKSKNEKSNIQKQKKDIKIRKVRY